MPASLSWNDQTDRIRAVFHLEHDQPIPRVNLDNLFVYKDYLQAALDGHPLEAEYREESGVGYERVLFCGISDEVDLRSGLWCSIFGDNVHGDYPLCEVTLSPNSESWQLVEDYKYWFRHAERG